MIRCALIFASRLALLFAFAACAWAQNAELSGRVKDPSEAVIANATITVTNEGTGIRRTTSSNGEGLYSVPSLPPSYYKVSVSAPGFQTVTRAGIKLDVEQRANLDFALPVGTASGEVTVDASTATLDRDSAATGGVISEEQVENLPINGRNWAALELLAPGAVNTGSGNQLSIRFAGRGIDDNKVTFDGVDATGILRQAQKLDLRVQLSSESIAEFRTQSTVYFAQYGGTTGGQVDVVSKTGTKSFHGSIYEFLRNDALNARPLFSTTQLPLRLNQFGVSVGGPIYQDHTFFFVNYEGLRQSLGQPLIGFVPSQAYLRATLAAQSALAPLLAHFPVGQTPTSNANVDQWNGAGRQTQDEDFGLVRVDQVFSPRTSAFVRINLDQGRLLAPNGDSTGYIGDNVATQDDPKNGVISLQHIFTPSLLNDLKFGVNRTPYYLQNQSLAGFQLTVPGFSTLHDTLQQIQASTAYSLVETVDLSFGKQSISAGGGLRHVELNLSSTQETQYAAASIANLQANTLNGATFLAALSGEDATKTEYNVFLQDQYKARPNILLSFGLRYDYFGAFAGVNGHDLPFDPLTCPAGYCQPGISFYNPDSRDIQPRVAVTWAPGVLRDKTVIRAGYGLYAGEGQLGDFVSPLNNLGQRLALSAAQLGTPSYPISPALTSGTLVSNAPKGLYRNRLSEQVDQWGLSIQQDLPFQMLGDIGYISSHGAHLPEHTVLNALNPNTRVAPLPAFGLIDFKSSGANSEYSGLVASLNRRFSAGMSLGATYIWSHSIDDGANVGNNAGAETDFPENVACRRCERASSDQDIRQSFTSNIVYELPFGHNRAWLHDGFASQVFGGWQFSGIGVARTGLPVNVTISRTAASLPDGNTTSPQRPNIVPGVSFIPATGRTPQNWINAAAFAIPANGTFGNAPRNEIRAPGAWQVDCALDKVLVGSDRYALRFRGDVYNVLNRAQYGVPAAVFNTASFGQITTQINPGATGTATQRVIQVSLRATF